MKLHKAISYTFAELNRKGYTHVAFDYLSIEFLQILYSF